MNADRRIEVEVEVPATPEQAWEAIATGPGITAWFMPAEVEGGVGGAVRHTHEPGMTTSGTITAYEAPHRFAYEEQGWMTDQADTVTATEFLVEARGGGTCVVRLVMSGLGEGEDWDKAIESFTSGWQSALLALRLYLEHFPGERAAAINVGGEAAGEKDAMWGELVRGLGLPAQPRVGDHLTATGPDAPRSPARSRRPTRVGSPWCSTSRRAASASSPSADRGSRSSCSSAPSSSATTRRRLPRASRRAGTPGSSSAGWWGSRPEVEPGGARAQPRGEQRLHGLAVRRRGEGRGLGELLHRDRLLPGRVGRRAQQRLRHRRHVVGQRGDAVAPALGARPSSSSWATTSLTSPSSRAPRRRRWCSPRDEQLERALVAEAAREQPARDRPRAAGRCARTPARAARARRRRSGRRRARRRGRRPPPRR